MKKPILAIAVFLTLAMTLIPTRADIPSSGLTWLGTTYSGIDPYYDQSVTVYAYRTGTTAVLAVAVTNASSTIGASNVINVTYVGITFDWGQTFNSTQVSESKPLPVSGAVRVIFVNFTVPDTTVASNLYRHYYTVTVDYTSASKTNSSQILRGSFSRSAQDFVVYSDDQADAMNLADIISTLPRPSKWNSSQAQLLANQASNETATALLYYREGDFSAAKTSYSNALSDLNQAWSNEQSYLTTLEDLQTQVTQAQISKINATTSFLNGLSTMWILLGIGWVLLSIGYIIKWLRRRPEPQTAAT
jgi:hypothetical protein